MHFTTLFILKGEELDNISKITIEQEFSDRFCYCCGETRPKYKRWCDWFQIGGCWNDINVLVAKRGICGENGCGEGYGNPTYSIVEINDLEQGINTDMIYAIATKSKIFEKRADSEKFYDLVDKINLKKIKGVIALLDCHD